MYILFLILFISLLAHFDDFEAAHDLVIAPALVALVGIFLAKPLYVFVKKKFQIKYGDGNKTNKVTHI